MIAAMLLPASYLAGSINFSIMLFKMLGKGDPRDQFSGNAGVTNVYRLAGIFWAGIVLFLDLGRACLVSWAALYLLPTPYVPWIGLVLIIGNRFPCFHSFQGGKGVANYLGFTAFISPLAALSSILVWLVSYGIFRIPFIASFFMVAVLMTGTIIVYRYEPWASAGTIATTLFILYNHKQNALALFRKKE